MKRTTIAILAAAGALAVGAVVASGTPRGCGAKCCQRPAEAPAEACLRVNPRTNVAEDFGAENSMPGTHAVGTGCVPAECVAGRGIEMEDSL